MVKKALSVLLSLLLLAGGSSAFAQQNVQTSKVVAAVKVRGNKAISTSTIMNRIKIQPGDVFEEHALNKEIKRLYAMGYFSDVFVETEERPEGVVVVFTVLEKPVIGNIEFRGNAKISARKLSKKLTIKKGELLDFNQLNRDVEAIESMYIAEGYNKAMVDYRIDTDPTTGNADVIFVVDEGEELRIKEIRMEGNIHIPDAELMKFMSTKAAWWFIQKGAFDDVKFRADLERIKVFYRSKGFLDVRVGSKVDYSEDGKWMFLTVVIDEGKKYLVGNMQITGQLGFPESQIKSRIKIRPGDPFDFSEIKEDVERVRSFYYDKGYMDADVDLQRKYNAKQDRMDLTFNITAHDIVYVGKVNVIGNTKTKDKVIRRELRLYPGDQYDGEKLKKSKERIYNLGFFEDVFFETVPTSQPGVKDLNVTVKETKTGEFSFGGGYSSIDAFIGFAQVKQRNFDIMAFPTFTGGGQDLTIRGEIGSTRNNFFVSWTDPWIFDFPYLFGFDFYRQEHLRNRLSGFGYDETRFGGSLKLGKEINDYLSTGLIYNLEEVKISNIADDASIDLRKELGTNWISRLTWNTNFDTRDNKFSPTKGIYTGLTMENAGGFLAGDKDFLKLYTFGTYYHSFFDKFLVLELKARMGVVRAYGDSDEVPIYERFFAGGANTIRGYKERAVGPRDKGSNTALGGDSMVIGNAEVTFPIWKGLIKGAVFFDAGAVHADYEDVFKNASYKMGVGAGVRVKTPIGPVKLDYGYPLSKNYDDKRTGEVYFSVTHGF